MSRAAVPPRSARALLCADDLERALEVLAETEPQLAPADTAARAAAGACRAWALYHQGAVKEAEAAASVTLASIPPSSPVPAPGCAGVIAACQIQRGQLDGAAATLSTLDGPVELSVDEVALLLDTRAQLRLAQRRPLEATVDALEAGRRLAKEPDAGDPGLVAWRSTAALARLALGDPASARELAEEELELARDGGVTRVILRCLRVLAGASKGPPRFELLSDAVALGAAAPMRLEQLHAMVDLGAVTRTTAGPAAARALLREARRLCRERGAIVLAGRAADELAAGRSRRRRPRAQGLPALTPSERRVAGLAAQGHTTRQMAAELFVSRKTIEFHLRHVYSKLGIPATRRDLARAFDARP